MLKDSSASFIKKRERLQKKVREVIKIFLKKRKTRSNNVVTNDIKISLKIKNKD